MTAVTLTSELEAINTMLDAAGESPVSTLETSGLADVAEAKAVLDETSRLIQEKGWSFNKEVDWTLVPDVDGLINLPTNTLKFDVDETSSASNQADTVQRGLKLYDRKNHTYNFTEKIKGTIVILLPWDELPQAARHYFMVRSARIYQTRALGAESQYKFSESEEFAALTAFKHAHNTQADKNMFVGSWSVANILDR